MTNGIGNPDWQRRYSASAVPLQSGQSIDSTQGAYPTTDANGYEYLMVIVDMNNTTSYQRITLYWSQDPASQQVLGNTIYVLGPGKTTARRVPVIGRYFQLGVSNVGGGNGAEIPIIIYGTNGGYGDLLEQNTAQPLLQKNLSIAAGATQVDTLSDTVGGRVNVCINDETNNVWLAFLQYYDYVAQNWVMFWVARGSDKGQSWNEFVNLPYAPCRLSVRNSDTTAHLFDYAVLGP